MFDPYEVKSILPTHSSHIERALEVVDIRVSQEATLINTWDADTIPDDFMPFLAWALSVDEWDPLWRETDKRAVIRESIEVHRRKGTPASIRRVLNAAGFGNVDIIEGAQTAIGGPWVIGDNQKIGGPQSWAEYWIILKDPISPERLDALVPILNATAPARCRLARVTVENASYAIGGPWAIGESSVTIGGTFEIGEL